MTARIRGRDEQSKLISMATDVRAALRAQLKVEYERVTDQLVQLGYGPNRNLQFDEGFADSGQVTAERGEADALAQNLAETLGEIEDALAKFESGTYGVCETCGGPISDARLEAMPMARDCINCANAQK